MPGWRTSINLRLMSRREFAERFDKAARKGRATVAGFNLPFDLSRLAVSCGEARGGRFAGGFSARSCRVQRSRWCVASKPAPARDRDQDDRLQTIANRPHRTARRRSSRPHPRRRNQRKAQARLRLPRSLPRPAHPHVRSNRPRPHARIGLRHVQRSLHQARRRPRPHHHRLHHVLPRRRPSDHRPLRRRDGGVRPTPDPAAAHQGLLPSIDRQGVPERDGRPPAA